MRPASWLLPLFLAACTTPPDPEPDPAPRAAPAAPACGADHVAAVRAELLQLCEIDEARVEDGMAVVDLPRRPSSAEGLAVGLDGEGLMIGGLRVPPDMQSDVRAFMGTFQRPGAQGFVLSIAGDAPATSVAQLLQDLVAVGQREGVLVFASTHTMDLPPPPDADRVEAAMQIYAALPDNARAVKASGVLRALMAECEPARTAYFDRGETNSCETFADGLSRAFATCNCPPEEIEIRSVNHALSLIGTDGTAAVVLPVRLDESRTFPEGETWQAVVDTLSLETEPIVLGVEPGASSRE